MDKKDAVATLLDWKIDLFYLQNKRLPDPFEEELLEQDITEDEIRDLEYYSESND